MREYFIVITQKNQEDCIYRWLQYSRTSDSISFKKSEFTKAVHFLNRYVWKITVLRYKLFPRVCEQSKIYFVILYVSEMWNTHQVPQTLRLAQ